VNNRNKITAIFIKAYLKEILHKRKETALCLISLISLMIAMVTLTIGCWLSQTCSQTITQSLKGIQPDLILQIRPDCNIKDLEAKLAQEKIIYSKARWDYGALCHEQEIIGIALIKTIDPENEGKVCLLDKKLTLNCDFAKISQPFTAIVGKKLYQDFVVNNQLTISICDENQFRPVDLTVLGYAATGFDEIDQSLIIISEQTSDWIFGKEAEIVQIKAQGNLAKYCQKIKESTGLTPESWEDSYPALSLGITIQKIATLIIGTLIIILALMATLLCFYALLNEKRTNTKILVTQALPENTILLINFNILQLIILIATALSMISALTLINLSQQTLNSCTDFQLTNNSCLGIQVPIIFAFGASILAFILTKINLKNCQNIAK
jgi:ABC-type lipoprotein release transport system permease subunit